MSRRVVITGIGAVSALGVGSEALWQGLCAGKSGLGKVSAFNADGFACRLGGAAAAFTGAKDFVPKGYRKAVKVMCRDTELAVAAAKLAVEDAKLVTRGTLPEESTDATTYPASRVGCQIGAGLIAAEAEELTAALATARPSGSGGVDLRAWGTEEGPGGAKGGGAMNNLPPLWMLKYLPNMLACHVTIIHGAEGPSNTITCVEASGLLSIGESTRIIQRGDATACFSGGAESALNLFRFERMELVRRLAATGDEVDGSRVVRPFDAEAPGQLLGEGAGILILEDREAAIARGATVHAEVVGYGSGQSASSEDAWMRGGLDADIDEGLRYAIENAIDDAGISPDTIDAIVPHASGIRAMDKGEEGALRAVFGARLARVPLVTLTPAIGDALAGQGGLAVAVGAMCVREQRLPARLHAGRVPGGLDAGPAASRGAELRHVLVCTGSLGGQNAAVVLRRA